MFVSTSSAMAAGMNEHECFYHSATCTAEQFIAFFDLHPPIKITEKNNPTEGSTLLNHPYQWRRVVHHRRQEFNSLRHCHLEQLLSK